MRIALVCVFVLASCGFEHGHLTGSQPDGDGGTDGDGPLPDTPIGFVARDCLDVLQRAPSTGDGPQLINPDGTAGAAPFTAYCDMTTAGGGWTLVYVYGFTDYANFDAVGNAATPRPTWTLTTTETTLVPVSTQVPTSPTSLGALEFARWVELGEEVLVTSNVNHWLRCRPASVGGGRITMSGARGDVTCTIEKVVAAVCTTAVPTFLEWMNRGPTYFLNSAGGYPHYYYWEASLAGSWPTHDPCGTNVMNQLTGIANPGGALFLRRL